MLSRADLGIGKIILSKDLTSDQTYNNLTFRLNSSGRAFSGANGLGTSTATSTVAFIHIGGFDDQRITAVMKYITPTTSGEEDFGVLARVQSQEDAASQSYYYARVSNGIAKLTRVNGGSYTNLSTSAFALPQDTDVTITLQVIGSAISATFNAGGDPTTVNLSAIDTSITSGGLMGFRTLTSTGYCKSFTVEQL